MSGNDQFKDLSPDIVVVLVVQIVDFVDGLRSSLGSTLISTSRIALTNVGTLVEEVEVSIGGNAARAVFRTKITLMATLRMAVVNKDDCIVVWF